MQLLCDICETSECSTVKLTSTAFAECLKDLQRFLRQDHPETRPAFTALSKYNLARADLVPLIVSYPEDVDLVYNARKTCTIAADVLLLHRYDPLH